MGLAQFSRMNALSAMAVILISAPPGRAAMITVSPGESIQAAIDAANGADIVSVAAGIYDGDIDFTGKAVSVIGAGADTIIRGTGNGPVVTFSNGEGGDSVLDSVLITGGLADRGGGIFIQGSSPTITRTIIFNNRARTQGSGVFIQASNAVLTNNLIVYNASGGGDPHSVEVADAAPQIINNTIARGDSNAIILRGSSPALVMNNILALNGGRGICDFSANGSAVIHYNDFFRNQRGALLTSGKNFRFIRRAGHQIGLPRLQGNRDGSPGFVVPLPARHPDPAGVTARDFTLNTARRSAAANAGNPDPSFSNRDGTRNTLGFTGGPEALDQP